MPPESAPDLWFTLLKSVGMLCVVLALLLGFLWLLRRMAGVRGKLGETGLIRVVAALPVAPREQVMLVEVMGEKILIGVTPQAINCLAILDREGTFRMPEPPPEASFMGILKGALTQGGGKVRPGGEKE